jgi:signal transduction histidine kinase/CheY-like chemotaxis protein
MAGSKLLRRIVLALVTAYGWGGASAIAAPAAQATPQIPEISIEQATSRSGSDFLPAFESRVVSVTGHVSEKAFWNTNFYLLPIRDEEDFGLLLRGSDTVNVQAFDAGDVVQVIGRIVHYRGMPILAVQDISKLSKGEAIGSRQTSLSEAAGFRNLGLPVEVEGRIASITSDASEEVIILSDGKVNLRTVLPKIRRDDELRLTRFRPGDRIRVSGIITQNAELPPYDRFFQLTLPSADRAALIESGGMIPAYLLLSATLGIGFLAGIWWIRDQRTRGFRAIMQRLHGLGEEIQTAGSLSEMLKKVELVLPRAARVSGVAVYLYDRKNRRLELVRSGTRAGAKSNVLVNPDAPANPMETGVSLCYRNGTAVNIPDTRRSDMFKTDQRNEFPRSILFLPMRAQDEIVGVMALYRDEGVRYFHTEEQASAQHLANQIAASLKLLEQRSVREQLFKSEKLAATGQLIAGVVNDLRSPVESVLTMSQLMLFRGKSEERELRILAADAQRTAEIVTRLISFGRNEDAVAKPVELNALLTGLFEFREPEWKSAGIQLHQRLSREGVYVVGAQGQLEQVFLNIILFAERAVAETGVKGITIGSASLGSRVLVDFSFPAGDQSGDPFRVEDEGGEGGLALIKGIVQSHGGEVRFEHHQSGTQGRIEIELPRAQATTTEHSAASGKRGESTITMTGVVIEPDAQTRRMVVSLLGQRGHRAIPVTSPEEALDLVQRVKCDVVFCTSRMPGFNWFMFYERARPHVEAFVLLLEESEVGHSFSAGEGHVLRKPVAENDVERVLNEIADQLGEPATAG